MPELVRVGFLVKLHAHEVLRVDFMPFWKVFDVQELRQLGRNFSEYIAGVDSTLAQKMAQGSSILFVDEVESRIIPIFKVFLECCQYCEPLHVLAVGVIRNSPRGVCCQGGLVCLFQTGFIIVTA